MTRLASALVVVAAVAVLPTDASAADPDPLYPVQSLIESGTGTADDSNDPALGMYVFESGFVNVPGRIAARLNELVAAGPEYLLQAAIDGALHARPTALGVNAVSTGDPAFMPDWNLDGTFGNAADYDVDNSDALAVAPFRYPCIALDGTVTYETTDGTCAASGDFKLGEARRIHVVNSRGLRLTATLWLPHTALEPEPAPHPGVVFAPGFISRQHDYYAYLMSAARAGFIGLGYDPAGQGQSEGSGFELSTADATGDCASPGACRDLQDIVRWFVGDEIVPSPTDDDLPRLTPRANPAYAPIGDNAANPVLNTLDTSRVGLFGQSMGSLATMGYLQASTNDERDAAGKPLPPANGAVAISGFTVLDSIDIPLQLQTADYDIPGYDETNGAINATDGPMGTKEWYDGHRERGHGDGSFSMLVFESGHHGDTTNAPYVQRAEWSLGLSTSYAIDHLSCHVEGDGAACDDAVSKRPRLSRIVASEYDVDGPAGPEPSRCISVPDKGSIAQVMYPDVMIASILGNPPYDCVTTQ